MFGSHPPGAPLGLLAAWVANLTDEKNFTYIQSFFPLPLSNPLSLNHRYTRLYPQRTSCQETGYLSDLFWNFIQSIDQGTRSHLVLQTWSQFPLNPPEPLFCSVTKLCSVTELLRPTCLSTCQPPFQNFIPLSFT